MAELKTTTIYGDAYVNNRVGIATRTPFGFLHVSQSYLVLDLTGSLGIGTSIPKTILNTLSQNGNGPYFDCGTSGGSGTTAVNINKSGTTYLNIRGDGYVGINASPSTNGQVYINSINGSTAHLSLASGITNSNASNAYTFRGWWGVHFSSPSFNGGTSQVYYIQIYS